MSELAKTEIGMAILSSDIPCLKKLVCETHLIQKHPTLKVLWKDSNGNSYLHFICTMNRPFLFHILAATDIDINVQDKLGNTALHITAIMNEPSHVQDLMACGINPLLKNNDGKTAEDIGSRNRFWKEFHDKFKPGIVMAVEKRDLPRLQELISYWSKPYLKLQDGSGQLLVQLAAKLDHQEIVQYLDSVKDTMDAVYGVLECDYDKVEKAVTRPRCQVNIRNKASRNQTLLQYAIKLQDTKMVNILCEAGCDINAPILIHGYHKGPLYFEILSPQTLKELSSQILNLDVDLKLKDENGRNALGYSFDKYGGGMSVKKVQFFIDRGINVSDRDMSGLNIRDVARFARRKDIVECVDKYLIKLLTTSNVDRLWELAVAGYEDFFIEYKLRDSFLYASGNETDDSLVFLEEYELFKEKKKSLHLATQLGMLDDIKNLADRFMHQDKLLCCKDKGGRTPLMLAVLFDHVHIVQYLVSDKNVPLNDVDNLGRSAKVYASALKHEMNLGDIYNILDHGCTSKVQSEYFKHKDWLKQERKALYGMDRELHCVDKYEELRAIIKSKKKDVKEFEAAINYFEDVVNLPKLLEPKGNELLNDFHDLIFIALEHQKEDIVHKLVRMGADCQRKEKVTVKERGDVYECYMNAEERARYVGYTQIADYIMYNEMESSIPRYTGPPAYRT